MDQEVQEIRVELKKLARLTEENNVMLHSVQRRARLSLIWSVFRWAIVIAIAVGSIYYIQPYLEQLAAVYESLTGNNLDFMNFFKQF